MNYEGQICRPPMERSSFMLPVMVGCSYNQCKFCNLFRHLKYRELPMEQIEAELKRVSSLNGKPQKIFLGDGNAFGLKTEHLLEILERIHFYFPECMCINMDATVTSILKKTDEELELLYKNGVRHLYLGIESGLDDVLRFMNKDHNLPQAYEAIERMHRVGFLFDAHIMTGVAGEGRGMENAEALAEFFSKTKPCHIINFSLFLSREVPLFRHVENGTFKPAAELESLLEERRLIELLGNLSPEHGMMYDGFHDFIETRTRGTLPRDAEKMLASIDKVIAEYKDRPPIYAIVQGQCPNLEKCDTGEKIYPNVS